MKLTTHPSDDGIRVVFEYTDRELLEAKLSPFDIQYINRNFDSDCVSERLLCFTKIARAIEAHVKSTHDSQAGHD